MVAVGYDAEGREVNITAVWVPAEDRAFATRLARYCARNATKG